MFSRPNVGLIVIFTQNPTQGFFLRPAINYINNEEGWKIKKNES